MTEPLRSAADKRSAHPGALHEAWTGALRVEVLPLGPFETNAWLLHAEGGGCWVVDPGMEPWPLVDRIEELGLTPERVLLTHGHLDHIAGCTELVRRFGARIFLPKEDRFLYDSLVDMGRFYGFELEAAPADPQLLAGDEVWSLGTRRLETLPAPGHTPGGVLYRLVEPGEADRVFCGDTIFAGAFGRTDLPGGSTSRLMDTVRRVVFALPDDARLLPGHGPETTVAREKAENPIRGMQGWEER